MLAPTKPTQGEFHAKKGAVIQAADSDDVSKVFLAAMRTDNPSLYNKV